MSLFRGEGRLALCPRGGRSNSTRGEFSINHVLTLLAADFNNDGIDDIAVGSIEGVNVYINNNSGIFVKNVFYPQQYGSTDIEVTNEGSDFNNDDYYDLCISTPSVGGDSSEIFIYYGLENGLFNQQKIRQLRGQVYGNTIADFNLDNNLDIAFINGSEKYIGIMYGTENGSFDNEIRYEVTGVFPALLENLDMDLDGDMDIMAFTSRYNSQNDLYVLENKLDPSNVAPLNVNIEITNNADYEIISSSGKNLNKVKNSLAASSQYLKNIDDNSQIDNRINLSVIENGEYKIFVDPKTGYNENDPFSLTYQIGG